MYNKSHAIIIKIENTLYNCEAHHIQQWHNHIFYTWPNGSYDCLKAF